jgi:hypothetical protein
VFNFTFYFGFVFFSLIDFKTKSSFTLPTPFYKHPFEFVGLGQIILSISLLIF